MRHGQHIDLTEYIGCLYAPAVLDQVVDDLGQVLLEQCQPDPQVPRVVLEHVLPRLLIRRVVCLLPRDAVVARERPPAEANSKLKISKIRKQKKEINKISGVLCGFRVFYFVDHSQYIFGRWEILGHLLEQGSRRAGLEQAKCPALQPVRQTRLDGS